MDWASFASYVPTLSPDWIIFGGLALFFIFDALRAGTARVTALAIALPIALLLSTSIQHAAYIGSFVSSASPAVQTGAFIALTFGLFVALYRIVDLGFDSSHPVTAVIAGIACAVICSVVLLQLPNVTLPWTFGPVFLTVFSEAYRLYWLLLAYIALAVARG